ncbi:MAG TPA: response regulator [Epulopiscium sp.]|nr:response regulator [Candidatus Epulonipiscium sp.]
MYSILLVDDELLVLETLRDYVDWAGLNCKVYTARNGQKAIEKIQEYEPDIIITDIQMPIMNGIELAKWVKETNQKGKLIFLTGYDDFDYIKEAFNVDAVDYILKPFSVEGIEETVNKIKMILEKENILKYSVSIAKGQMLEKICTDGSVSESIISEFEKLVGSPRDQISYGVACLYGDVEMIKDELVLNELAAIEHIIRIKGGLVFIINPYINPKDCAKRIQKLLFTQYNKKYLVIYEDQFVTLERLSVYYNQFNDLQKKAFYMKDREIRPLSQLVKWQIPKSGKQTTTLIAMIETLQNAIIEGKSDKAAEVIKTYLCGLIGNESSDIIRQVETIYILINEQITKIMIQENEMKRFDYFYDIEEDLISYVTIISDGYQDKRGNPNYYLVEYVKQYVSENYMNPINIDYMADGIHLSPNYLRAIFKEVAETTIGDYITDYRFNKASNLLKQRKYKVKEISLMVGYENVSYFCSQFTKRYGKTPTEYRKML